MSNNPGYSVLPCSVVDSMGQLHAVWFDFAGNQNQSASLFYSYRSTLGEWSTPVVVNPQQHDGSWQCSIALGTDDKIHVVWIYDFRVYYASRNSIGVWSAITDISGPISVGSPERYYQPEVVVDSLNRAHVIWSDLGGIWYVTKAIASSWSAPALIADAFSPHAITVSPDDILHVVFTGDGIHYLSKPVNGNWGQAVVIFNDISYDIRIQSDSSGCLHLLWQADSVGVKYSTSSPSDPWSVPLVLSTEYNGFDLAIGNEDVHILLRNSHGLTYQRTFDQTTWSPVIPIYPVYSGYGFSISVQGEHVYTLWAIGDYPEADVYFNHWEYPLPAHSAISQVVTISSQMNAPTLSYMYKISGISGAGTFNVLVNNLPVVTQTQATSGWSHAWLDLSAWSGQAVTVTYEVENDFSQGAFEPLP